MEWNSELHDRESVSRVLMSHSLWPDSHRSWSRTGAVRSGSTCGDHASTSKLFRLTSQWLIMGIIRIFFLKFKVWETHDKMYYSLKFILIIIVFYCQHSSSVEELDTSKYVLAVDCFSTLAHFYPVSGHEIKWIAYPRKTGFPGRVEEEKWQFQWENRRLFLKHVSFTKWICISQ